MRSIPTPSFDPALPTRVLFVGGGQDSVALLMKYVYDPAFRAAFVGCANFCAVMADTGNEYPETIVYVSWLKRWCAERGINFTFVTPDMGYHGKTWLSLTAQMERNSTVMGVAFPKSCTDNLKVKVCYRFLAQWLRDQYGYSGPDTSVYYQYRHYHGKLISWIGFASGEEGRVAVSTGTALPKATTKKPALPTKTDRQQTLVLFADESCAGELPAYLPKWRKLCVQHRYPLIELGYDRAACQAIIAGYGQPVPMPSNCMFCPFQNAAEIVYLYRALPDQWAYWVEREAAKLAKFAYAKANFGVKRELTLTQYLERALKTYGGWSLEQLRAYRFSHGHCVTSKY